MVLWPNLFCCLVAYSVRLSALLQADLVPRRVACFTMRGRCFLCREGGVRAVHTCLFICGLRSCDRLIILNATCGVAIGP